MSATNGSLAPKHNRVGRPTALTPDVAATIICALRSGNFLETACSFAGIAASTLRNWLRAGRRGTTPELVEFYRAVTRARAAAEMDALDRIGRDPAWQAAAWRLERMHPQRYARRTRRPKQESAPPVRPLSEVMAEIRSVLDQAKG
jgi:hypothetical protein